MTSYLNNRKQFVDFDGTNSTELYLSTGVPQGSILGPLLFIIYMNDICHASKLLRFILYADDSTLLITPQTIGLSDFSKALNAELTYVSNWLDANKLSLNVKKSKFMVFSTFRRDIHQLISTIKPQINGSEIERVTKFNFLGLVIDENVSWHAHTNLIWGKISRVSGILNRLKHHLPTNILRMLYNSLVLPHLNYSILVWGHNHTKVQKLQKKIIRIISNSKYNAHTDPIFKSMNLLKITDILHLKALLFYYKYTKNTLPEYMLHLPLIPGNEIHTHNTRSSQQLRPNSSNMRLTERCIDIFVPKIINSTQQNIVEKIYSHCIEGFKFHVKFNFISQYQSDCTKINCYVCKN